MPKHEPYRHLAHAPPLHDRTPFVQVSYRARKTGRTRGESMICSSRLPQSGVGARRLHDRIKIRAISDSDPIPSSLVETMETACPHAAQTVISSCYGVHLDEP